MPHEFQGVFLISCIAVIAPLLARSPYLSVVPIVAMELMLGVLIGPSGLKLVVNDAAIDFIGKLGLVFLFFQAGFEFKLKEIGREPLRLGLMAWLGSLATAIAIVALLYLTGLVRAPILVAIILTTTAFGVLLPVLRQADDLKTDFGRHVMGSAAIGELGPLLLASIALAGDKHHLHQTVLSTLFLALVVVVLWGLAAARGDHLARQFSAWLGQSDILPVRVALVMLLGFVSLADAFGMETVVGAYAAGLAITLLVDGERRAHLEDRLTAIGSGFFVPVFFVASGIELDLSSLVSSPSGLFRFLLFCAAFLAVRIAPLHLYRRALSARDLPALALLSSTTLPLVVAIAYLGARSGGMAPENASALVAAAVVTVTLFPTLALALRRASRKGEAPGRLETLVDAFTAWGAEQADRIVARYWEWRRSG
jgi:Kef-type K+ transport system membrane component KefB